MARKAAISTSDCATRRAQRGHGARLITAPDTSRVVGVGKVRLGEVCEEFSVRNRDGKVSSVYSVTNSGGFIPSTEYFSKEVYSKSLTTYKIVEPGMFAYNPSRINVGSVNRWIGEAPVIVSPLYIVVNPDSGSIEGSYLNYFLHSKEALCQIRNLTEGSVRDSLKFSGFQRLSIPLPPLPAQRRIATELDRLCALKKNAEDRLAILDQIVKSRFVEMFGDPVANPLGWKVRKISEFAEVKIGPFGSVLHKEDYVSSGHPIVNPSHMKDGQICVDDDLTLADEKYNELEVYHLRIGDVVVARRGEIGRCALVESDGLFCGTGSMFVRVKGDCRPDYLQRVISFPTYTAKLEFGAVGVTMKNINAGMIEDSLVPLPPMPLQDSFAAFVAEVDKSKFALRETVATLDQLYRAKLQEYFG